MKVYIGPYRNYFSLYPIVEPIGKLLRLKEETIDNIVDRFSFITDWLNEKFIKRKISIQLHKYDTYSMDHTLALIILPMLKQLKATKHGVPSDLVPDEYLYSNQVCFDFYKDSDIHAIDIGSDKWDEILDKMIFSFESILDENSDSKYFKEIPDSEKHPILGHKLEVDYEGLKNHQEKVQEGLNLFGKYYQSLWD